MAEVREVRERKRTGIVRDEGERCVGWWDWKGKSRAGKEGGACKPIIWIKEGNLGESEEFIWWVIGRPLL